MKRFQNKIAESRHTLPLAMLYGAAIWVLAGLFQHGWWVQFACFILSTLLVMRINSLNLLIRIYSRSVSVAFIFLSCAAVCLFPSWRGGIEQLCCIAAFMLLTECYQDNTTVGKSYYIFLLSGIATMLDAHVIFYLPLIWLMMRVIVYSLSWRTFLSSLLGLITPYWFMSGWLMWEKGGDYHAIARLFSFHEAFQFPFGFESIPLPYQLVIAFTTLMLFIGSVHFIHSSYRDKIRVRQIYYGFITLGFFSLALLVLQPQNELACRMLIFATSPLIGHYWALTNSKISNVMVIILTVALILITAVDLWISSFPS